jgi:hypothetical protein
MRSNGFLPAVFFDIYRTEWYNLTDPSVKFAAAGVKGEQSARK